VVSAVSSVSVAKSFTEHAGRQGRGTNPKGTARYDLPREKERVVTYVILIVIIVIIGFALVALRRRRT
jgi:hypothetical protein